MINAVDRKRIEILVDGALLRRITEAADLAGISGYTLMPISAGKGRGGVWTDDQITGGVFAKECFYTVCNEEKAQKFLDLVKPLLDSHGLVMFISDVKVIRSSKFS
jgi:nitrogen regulatory protein PII